jgi:hypothetical protein
MEENDQKHYTKFGMIGRNVGKEELTLKDAYFSSGITGAQVHLKVQMPANAVSIGEINPVRPNVMVGLFMEIDPPVWPRSRRFLETMGTL